MNLEVLCLLQTTEIQKCSFFLKNCHVMFKECLVADDNGECAVLARELTSRFDECNCCSCKVLHQ